MKVVRSTDRDPLVNFCLEKDFLFDGREDVVMLYINCPSVIVGRNQCMEAEADVDFCRRNGIAVLRRISGGGAVYHDYGNINFSFITDCGRTALLDSNPAGPIVEALAHFGVNAGVGPRGELTVDGLKISGTASYSNRSRQLFHGTLLFDTDFAMMRNALNGERSLRGRKIASVPSPTANISGMLARRYADASDFMDGLACFFRDYYKAEELYVCRTVAG